MFHGLWVGEDGPLLPGFEQEQAVCPAPGELWEHGSLGSLAPSPEFLPLFQSLRSEGLQDPTGMEARRGWEGTF